MHKSVHVLKSASG